MVGGQHPIQGAHRSKVQEPRECCVRRAIGKARAVERFQDQGSLGPESASGGAPRRERRGAQGRPSRSTGDRVQPSP